MKTFLRTSIISFSFCFVFICFLFTPSVYGQTVVTFSTPGSSNFTIPAGVTTILVKAWGGGAGGTTINKGSAGGGGGAYASSVLSVTAGSSYTVTVGSGGAANANGGNSSFGSAVVAAGAIGQLGGLASSSVGTTRFNGGNGGNGGGNSNNSAGGGGGGSATSTGIGSDGSNASGINGGAGGNGSGVGGKGGNGNSGTNGANGTSPGAGGGGKGDGGSSGAGASGLVVVYYYSFTGVSTSAASCPGTPAQITINSGSLLAGTNYTVSYSLSGANTGNFTANMTVAAAGSGTFSTGNLANAGNTTITITNISDGSVSMAPSGTTTASITVAAQPMSGTLAKTPNKTAVCVGDLVSATLSAPGSGGAGTVNDVLEYRFDGGTWTTYTSGVNLSTSGHTSVEIRTYRTASGSGCTQSTANIISWTVNARPTVTIGKTETSGTTPNDGIICTGSSVTLTGTGSNTTGPYTYAWVTGATTIANTQAVTVSPTAITDYLLTVTDGNSCTNTETFTVNVNDLPTPTISVAESSGTTDDDGITCTGGSVTLTASGGSSYSWSTGSTNASITVSPTAPLTQTTTTYTVDVTDGNGCKASANKTVTVNPLPTVSAISGTLSVCVGSTTTLGNANSGTWTSLNTSIATVNSTTGEVTGVATGNATIQHTINDGNGCINSTTATVTVNALPTLTGVSSSTATICSGTGATITLSGLLPNKTHTIEYTIEGGDTETTTVTANGSGVAAFTTIGLGASNSGNTLTITGITRTDVTPGCTLIPSNAQTTLPTVTPIDLIAPVIDKPAGIDVATICEGQTLTVNVTTPGSGGTTDPQDEFRYSTNGGATWSAWSTSVPNFAAVAGTNIIQAQRTATGGVCAASGTNSKTWVVVAKPTVSAPSPAVQDACINTAALPLSVNPSGGTGDYTYQWYSNTTNSNTNGDLISGETNATFTPPTGSLGTTYYYCVITDAGIGCGFVASATASVTVDAQPVSGTLTKSAGVNMPTVCRGTNVSATLTTAGVGAGTDILEYSYDDSDNWSIYTSGMNLSTAGHTKVEIRTYRTAAGTNCTASTPATVVWSLDPRPTVTIDKTDNSGTTPNDGIICTGASVTLTGTGSNTTGPYTYAWVTGATTIANTQAVLVSPTANTDYLLTVTDGKGCARTETFTVTVNALPSPAITVAESPLTGTQDGTICHGGSVTLTAIGGSSYSWSTGSTNASVTVSPTAPSTQTTTTYTVDVTDGNGCLAQAGKTVTVNPLPVVTLSSSQNTPCVGTTVTYNTQPGQSGYIWTLPTPASEYTITGGSITSNTITLQWNTNGSKTVKVAYTNSDGCLGADASVNTTVNSLPAITTTGTLPSICESNTNQTATLAYTATTGSPTSYSIDWDNTANSAGLVDQGNTSFSFSAGGGTINTIVVPGGTLPGTYSGTLTISNANGCTKTQAVSLTLVPANTVGLASSTPTLCISTALTPITHTTTGATGIGVATGLPAGVTAAWASNTITISGTPTAAGTFNYAIPLTGGCGSVSATGTITVDAASAGGTISPAITTVCANAPGGTLTLSGHNGSIVRWEVSSNGGTTWTTIANTTATQSYTTTGTRLYRAVIQNGTCGVVYSTNAVISVIPAATTPTATASPATICAGQTSTLSATAAGFFLAGDIDGTFNRANPAGWRITENGTEINFPANADNANTFPWSETNGPKTPFDGGVTYNNLQTDGKFAIASGLVANTTMETPVFSTIGMTSAMLQFYQALVFTAGASGKIEISTDGGVNYTKTLIQYNGPMTIGVPANNWNLLNIDLSDYIGLSNLRIRFTYTGANNSNWAIDGFGFPGQAAPVTYQWTPTATLTPNTGLGQTVTANPTVTTTYTVTTTINGCPGGSQQVTVNVNPVTVITAQPTGGQADGSGLYCETATINPLTVTATGTAPLSYQWYSMAGATPAPATDPKVGTNSNSFTPPKTVGTTTYYVVVTGGCGSQTSTAVPVTIVPPLVLSQLAPAEALCYQSQVNLRIVASVPANVATYQWYRAAGTTPAPATDTKIGTNSPTYTIPSLTPADNGNYYVVVTGKSPCNEVLTSNVVTVTSYTTDVTIWTSGDDTDEWHEDLNWTCGIPTLYKDAIVPIVPNNKYPYIDGTSGLVGQTRKLTIDAGGPSVSVDGLLQMAGEVTNNGTLNGYLNGVNSTGTIEFVSNINFSTQYPNNSTYAQQLVSTAGTPVTQTQNLKISNLVTITIPVDVYGQLSFGGNNKTLATNDKLTLKSVSEMATAMVTDPTHGTGISQGNVINGKATVERYIPAYGTRKWRLVTSPVKGVSINSSWQEGRTWNNGMAVENGNKFGTLITGGSNFATAGAANAAGFDFWPLPLGATSSVRDYSGSGDLVSNDLATWPQMASTLTPNAFDDHRTYLVYVRGDRSVSTGSVVGWTVLRAKGLLKEELTHQIPLMPQSHTMFGNPYASPLDYKLIYNANSGKIQPYFWIWQARLAGMYGLGGYVLMLPDGTNTLYEAIPSEASGSASLANRMVHSGQGIFVMPQTSPAPTFPTSITIAQTHKSTTLPGISAFRQMGPGPSKIYINLQVTDQTNAATLMDGGLAQYDASFANGKGFNIAKAINSGENLSIFKGGKDLIVASDVLPSIGDTLRFRIWNTNSSRAYQLKITGLNFLGTGLSAILVDKYLGKEKELNVNDDSTFYSFNLTGQPGARDPQRFYIVFRASQAPLPLVISELGAEEQAGGEVLVSWKVEDETGIKLYEVEKSGDGNRFVKLSEQPARAGAGPQAYESLDGSPSAVTYYRIRMTGVGGEVKYSDVVKVQLSSRREAVVLYPNPLNSGEALQVQLQNKPAGVYRLTLFNDQGQRVWSQSLQHSGGTATQVTDLPGSLSSGHYKVELRHTSGKKDMLNLHILK